MRKLIFLLFGVIGFLSFKPLSDSEDVINALKSGNSSEVAEYFDNFIDLTLPEKEEIKNIGKNQATLTLKSFYEENGIKGFILTSQRESGATMYITGKLQGRLGNKNITILLKTTGSKINIISLRIS